MASVTDQTGTRLRFKYQVIAEQVGSWIASGEYPPSSVLPSEVELAEHFSVNRMTMRKALGLLCEEGVLKRYQGKGTVVIGPIGGADLADVLYIGPVEAHLFNNIVRAAQRQAQQRGVRFQTLETPRSDDSAWQATLAVYAENAGGFIVAAESYPIVHKTLSSLKRPVVVVGDEPPKGLTLPPGTACVLADQMRAIRVAMEHLLELGHRRILLAEGDANPAGAQIGARQGDRAYPEPLATYYGAYRGVLATHGVADWEGVVNCYQEVEGVVLDSILAFLQAPDRPTAVVCQPDFRARGIYAVAALAGLRIPEDLSVIGINDTPWCPALSPALSSVNVGESLMGRLAMDILIGDMPEEHLSIRVSPSLCERDSTAPVGRTT